MATREHISTAGMVEVQSASSFHKRVHSQVITMKTLKEDTQIRRVCVYDMDRGPFSLISPLTLSNHPILGPPLSRTFPSSFFLGSALLFSSYADTSSASYIGLPLRFPHFRCLDPVSFIPYSVDLVVTSHIRRSNFLYCAFCKVPAPILPLSCTASPGIFTFIFCHLTLHRFSSSSSNCSAR